MNKKTCAAGVLAALLLAAPASAHCDASHAHGCWQVNQPVAMTCPECTVEGCTIAGRHLHNGITYCGTHHVDGVCSIDCLTAANTSNTAVASGHHSGHHGGHHSSRYKGHHC